MNKIQRPTFCARENIWNTLENMRILGRDIDVFWHEIEAELYSKQWTYGVDKHGLEHRLMWKWTDFKAWACYTDCRAYKLSTRKEGRKKSIGTISFKIELWRLSKDKNRNGNMRMNRCSTLASNRLKMLGTRYSSRWMSKDLLTLAPTLILAMILGKLE